MADGSPDTKNGFTPIAHELLEAMVLYPFSKRQYKVLLCVLRRTYGFNKKADDMSYGQIASATGMRRQNVIKTVQELDAANVLKVTKSGRYVRGGELNRIGPNKCYAEWGTGLKTSPSRQTANKPRLVSKHDPFAGLTILGLVSKRAGTSLKTCRSLVSKHVPTIETNTKERKKGVERKRSSLTTIDEYLTECRAANAQAIPPDSAVVRYANEAGISAELLRVCFYEFVERYRSKSKKQKDWPATFLNCVRANWYRLWWMDDAGQCAATSIGRQAFKVHEERRHVA